jgi:hypothetical protein
MEVRKFESHKVGNLDSPYRAYRELFQKRIKGEPMDDLRLDAMIALRMLFAVYSFEDVVNG